MGDYSDMDSDQDRSALSQAPLISTGRISRETTQAAIGAGQWSAISQEQWDEMNGDGKKEKKEKKKKKKEQEMAFGITKPEYEVPTKKKKKDTTTQKVEVLDLTDDSYKKSNLPSMKKPNP